MTNVPDVVTAVAEAPGWNARVALVRTIPEQFGTSAQSRIYSQIALRVYVPELRPDFAYVHWREEYELPGVEAAYHAASSSTDGFRKVDRATLCRAIEQTPTTLRIFRLLLGFTVAEFAEVCGMMSRDSDLEPVTKSSISLVESGQIARAEVAATCAAVIDGMMRGELLPKPRGDDGVRRKLDKPDTQDGWDSVRYYAEHGVPLPLLLHQRAYGGAFRQLLDATSGKRGDLLEEPVEHLFQSAGIPHLRTGNSAQDAAAEHFGLTVKPAPDFVVYDKRTNSLRAILECKAANDGGTARDKASRFRSLRTEANRLGGVPVFAVLAGLGWKRTGDALGPVIRDTDGRVFTLANLAEMLTTEPFPSLRGQC